MSKKRKTRSQKEKSLLRRDQITEEAKNEVKTPMVTYSVKDIATPHARPSEIVTQKKDVEVRNMMKDIKAIGAATGIIIAFDILLFTLLSSGVLKLGFLGY